MGWAANLEADEACSQRSKEAFSFEQALRTDSIDQIARARNAWLGRRCSHILAHDPVPKVKELKFEAAPTKASHPKSSGPNKRQQLLAATQAETTATGHKWSSPQKAHATFASNAQFAPCVLSRWILMLSLGLCFHTLAEASRQSRLPMLATTTHTM